MDRIRQVIDSFFVERYISFNIYLLIMLYMGISFLIIYVSFFQKNEKNIFRKLERINKKSIFQKEYDLKSSFFKSLKQKYNINPVQIKNEELSFSGFLMFNILFFIIVSAFILIMLKKLFILAIIPGTMLGGLLTIICTNMQYEKRKREFEKAFPDIGLTINQNIQNPIVKKELREILERIIQVKKSPVKEEFILILNDYKSNNDIKRALENITKRYPDSQYLPRLKDIFEIYYETKDDISDIVNITVDQVRNYEEIKKKTEIEIAPYIRIIYSIWLIGYSFLAIYLITNKLTRIFYKSRQGIVYLLLLNFIMFVGVFIIEYLKLEVSKDEFLERIE
jgi:Flp pilus assembly protein TadB